MSKYENSHKEQIELKFALKVKLETLKHKHILEEIEALKKAKVKSFERYTH